MMSDNTISSKIKVDQLMVDAIDLHVHCSPDAFTERRLDALQLAQQASESGMKHVVIKSHQYCTSSMAYMVNKIINKPILVGSLVLNAAVGGLNPEAVRVGAKEGAKIIWLPTTSSEEEIKIHYKKSPRKDPVDFHGISVMDNVGNLVPEMKEILSIIKKNNLILATGHISIPEAITVANESLAQGIKTIITHPFAKPFGVSLNVEQAKDLVKRGAYIEFCFISCMPPMRLSPLEIVNYTSTFGPDHCLLTTDFGQVHNPPPTEGFRMMLSYMIKFGLSENELETMVKTNPHKLLF
jgi:hypothetical protein